MTWTNRRKFIALTGTAGLAGLAGCSGDDGSDSGNTDENSGNNGGDSSSGSVEERDLKVGTLLPESGPLASTGSTMADAADLAFTMVDDESDYFSVDATFGDSQSTASDGISAANNLANAGIPAVVGGASTNVHISASEQVFIPNRMCACSPSATAANISQIEDNGLLYRTIPSDALQGQVMAQYAIEELGASTAAVLNVNDDYGSALSGSFVNAFENEGGSVQEEVSYETSASSYTSRISSAVSGDPDMLVLVGYPESGIQLFRDYYAQFSADRDIMTVDGLNSARIPNEVGRDMGNVVGTAPLVEGPGQDTFDRLYRDAFDTAPGPFNPQTFDAAAVLLLANAAAGENSGEAIAAEMQNVVSKGEIEVTPDNLATGVDAAAEGEDVVYTGASSQINFNDNGDLNTAAYEIWKYAPDTERGIDTVSEFTVN